MSQNQYVKDLNRYNYVPRKVHDRDHDKLLKKLGYLREDVRNLRIVVTSLQKHLIQDMEEEEDTPAPSDSVA